MESMDNKEFDRDLRAKLEHFEGSVPLCVWDKIEQELDTGVQKDTGLQRNEEFPSKSLVSTNAKSIRRLARHGLRYASIAAMLFIAFTFWKLNDTPVVYLKNNEKLTGIVPANEEKRATEGGRIPLESEPAEIVESPSMPKEITVGRSFNLPDKAAYATLNDVEASAIIGNTSMVAAEDQESQVGFVELDIALVPVETVVQGRETRSGTEDGRGLVSQEPIDDVEQDQPPVYAEVESVKKKKIGVSTVLNFLAKGFSNEDGKSIEFSESEEGILQWDITSSFAKNREGK